MTTTPLTIKADQGVMPPSARRPGRSKDENLQALVDQFLRMKIGESFFYPDAKRRDIDFLRKPVMRAGAVMQVVETTCDEIYNQPGIRCWRWAGEYDEL